EGVAVKLHHAVHINTRACAASRHELLEERAGFTTAEDACRARIPAFVSSIPNLQQLIVEVARRVHCHLQHVGLDISELCIPATGQQHGLSGNGHRHLLVQHVHHAAQMLHEDLTVALTSTNEVGYAEVHPD